MTLRKFEYSLLHRIYVKSIIRILKQGPNSPKSKFRAIQQPKIVVFVIQELLKLISRKNVTGRKFLQIFTLCPQNLGSPPFIQSQQLYKMDSLKSLMTFTQKQAAHAIFLKSFKKGLTSTQDNSRIVLQLRFYVKSILAKLTNLYFDF